MDPELASRMVFINKNFGWYEEFLQKKASGRRLKWYGVGMVPVGKRKVKAMGDLYVLWNSVRQ
jgi:hypothetical protein